MGLHFKTLGVPELFADGQCVVRLRYRKAYALLGYLAVERNRWHERRSLADLLWPRLAPEAARANLRLVLKSLADAMSGAGDSDSLRLERDRVGLFFDRAFHVDVLFLDEEQRRLLRQCADHAACVGLLAAWRPGLEQMQGEFLAGVDADENGPFDDWLSTQRASCERARAALLRECVATARRCGALQEALLAAQAWIRCCPGADDAACALMELLAAGDGPRAAVDAYADFAQRLESLVGALPAADTAALHERFAAAAMDVVPAAPANLILVRDEVRRVVVLHVEPEFEDEAELLEPQRCLAPLATALDETLERWGGRQFPVSGVALGAVFGLAADGEQGPRRALRAALELAAMPAFRRSRIGLAEGKALIAATARQPIAGSILPTLAQRLAMCGDPGDVIVAAALAGELGARAGFEPLARRRFAGLAGEHDPCRLLAAAGSDDDPAGGVFATPFVGRWEELLRLSETVATAAAKGRALFVEVGGAAGTGKSRLLAEFARTHVHAGGVVRWIGHRPELRHVALGAVREYLRRQGESTGTLAGHGLIDVARARLFAPSGTRRPVLLVFDDLHWADETTRELLAGAMQAPPSTPVLAIFSCRPAMGMAPLGGSALPHLALQPLTVPEAMALIAAIDPDGDIDNARRSQLAKLSGGLPLCTEYIARAARDQPVSDASLFGVLQSVLDRMGPDKPVFQAASVLGVAFRDEGLRTLLPEHDIAPALKRAEVLAIVEARGEGTYAFRHALLRDCAYESAPPAARRDWHRAAAAWLSQQPDAAPADIAQHYEAAHAWPEARDAWRTAATTAYLDEFPGDAKAAALRALTAATKQGQGVAVAEQAELELLAGYSALMTDGYGAKGAQKFFAPLVARSGGELHDETMFRALTGMVAAFPQGRSEGFAMMRRIEAMARSPAQRMMVHYGLGSLLHWRSDFSSSMYHIEEAIRGGTAIPAREWLRYSADDPVIACRALKAVNLAFSVPGDAAVAAAALAVSEARRAGRMHGLCFALTLAASVHLVQDRPDEVERLAAEGLALATQRRFQFWQAYNAMFVFWAKARRGQGVMRKSFKLLALHREIAAASRLSPVTSWWFVACICEALESWSLLDTVAVRGLSLAVNGGDTYCMPDLMRQRALARHAGGDAAAARRWLERAAALMETQGNRGLAPRLARVEALIAAAHPALPAA